jgi:hypothetical protein
MLVFLTFSWKRYGGGEGTGKERRKLILFTNNYFTNIHLKMLILVMLNIPSSFKFHAKKQ